MPSVKAIYDGKSLRLLQPVNVSTPQEVIITFLQDDSVTSLQIDDLRGANIQQLVGQSKAFDFPADEAEDGYADADLKVTY